MLSGLKTYFGANVGLTAQIGARLHRVTAPANSGPKYVTYRRMDDARRLRTGGAHSLSKTNRVAFKCHGATLADADDVYDALRAVIGETQFRGNWGTAPVYVIESAYWDGDAYEEDVNSETQEYTISIDLIVTWKNS